MYLKPFLSIIKISEKLISIGLTDRFRVTIPNEEGIKHDVEINKLSSYLEKLGLVNKGEGKIKEADSRTISYLSLLTDKPVEALASLRSKSILVLGSGGLGSRIVLELAAMGVVNITVVDPRFLSESNLQRLHYYNRNQVGLKKVNLIMKACKKINPLINLKTHFEDSIEFVHNSNLSCFDFVFVTADADDGSMAWHIGKDLKKSRCPHLIGGYWESLFIIGPIIDKNSQFDLREQYDKFRSKFPGNAKRNFTPPSVGSSNAVISGIMLNEFMKYIITSRSDLYENQLQIDLLNLKSKWIPLMSQ